jgi:hypothetical protein
MSRMNINWLFSVWLTSDLEAIRVMAENSGIPDQTLINHIIHLYVTGQRIHAEEVRKLVKAGAFS